MSRVCGCEAGEADVAEEAVAALASAVLAEAAAGFARRAELVMTLCDRSIHPSDGVAPNQIQEW